MPNKPICSYYRKHSESTITCQRGDPKWGAPIRIALFNNEAALNGHMKNACSLHYTSCKKYRELEKL